MKMKTKRKLTCLHDQHEMTKYPRKGFVAKKPIPEGAEVEHVSDWSNLVEGSMVRIRYGGNTYDVKPKDVQYI